MTDKKKQQRQIVAAPKIDEISYEAPPEKPVRMSVAEWDALVSHMRTNNITNWIKFKDYEQNADAYRASNALRGAFRRAGVRHEVSVRGTALYGRLVND